MKGRKQDTYSLALYKTGKPIIQREADRDMGVEGALASTRKAWLVLSRLGHGVDRETKS